jgi:hypothetical protein
MVIDFIDLLLESISRDVPRILSVLVRTILLFLFFWYCAEFFIESLPHPALAIPIAITMTLVMLLMVSSLRDLGKKSSKERLSVLPGGITAFASLNLLPILLVAVVALSGHRFVCPLLRSTQLALNYVVHAMR